MPTPFTLAKKRRALRYHEKGMSVSDIAKKMGSAWMTIDGAIKELKKEQPKKTLLPEPIVIPAGSKVTLIVDGMVVYETK